MEDYVLCRVMESVSFVSWSYVAKFIPGRTARQCRDRWKNYLSPELVSREWDQANDKLLMEKVHEYGTKWSMILDFFPGMSYSCLKNRYYSISKGGNYRQSKNKKEILDENISLIQQSQMENNQQDNLDQIFLFGNDIDY